MLGTNSGEIHKTLERLYFRPGPGVGCLTGRHVGQQSIDGLARDTIVDEYISIIGQAASRDAIGTHLSGTVKEAIGLHPSAMTIRDQIAGRGTRALTQPICYVRLRAVRLTLVDEWRCLIHMHG